MSGEVKLIAEGNISERQDENEAEKVTMMAEELEDVYKNHPLTEDTTCGYGFLRGPCLQRFSNEKYFVLIYGLVGCLFGAGYAYFNGTISTIEKRFKIPSKVSGMIVVGYDCSALFVGLFLSYYAGKQHRPRIICLGIYTVVLYCLLTLLPHLLYGVGDDALALTLEYGGAHSSNSSQGYVDPDLRNVMCFPGNGSKSPCKEEEGGGGLNTPAVILFLGNLVCGIGGGLYTTIGLTYMDDNIEKSKIPFLISLSHFLKLMGPALGYSLASLSLNMFIAPSLTPTITSSDPRWMGAWWMGWIVLSTTLFVAGSVLALFPRTLPAAAARKMVATEKARLAGGELYTEEKPSFSDMVASFWRLLTHKAYMCIQLSNMFYMFGYNSYWIFMAKYTEMQYHMSASRSSLFTGPFGIVFSALGTLLAGATITRLRPSARSLVCWNLLVVSVTAVGSASFAFLGCQVGDSYGATDNAGLLQLELPCNVNCSCDHVRYTPVCSQYGDLSYISPCHAGCSGEKTTINGSVVYTDCSCVSPYSNMSGSLDDSGVGGYVREGVCPADCARQFIIFISIACLLKFTGATSKSSNFLVSIRSVEERDKVVSMALSIALMAVFAFIPSPVFFGYLLDKACIVWGKSCTGKGNCWTYDNEAMRKLVNLTAAGFIAIGAMFDVAVWYYVKDVKIFDEEIELKVLQENEGQQEKLISQKVTIS